MVDINNFFIRLKKDSFYRDTFFLFFSTMIMNFGGFLYHFVMGRFLGPEQYSILGVILSFVYIFFVGSYVLQTSISKFIAEFKAKNQEDYINDIYKRFLKKITIIGIVLFVLFLAASFFLANILQMPLYVLFIFDFSIPFMLLLGITRGLLQGLQNFRKLGYSFIIETTAKFLFGFLLVYFGFNVFGAVFGISIGYLIPFLYLLYSLRKHLKNSKNGINSNLVYSYSIPVFFVLLFLTLFYSLDVFFVKYYFDSLNAGYYVAVALLGRVLFFASFSIVFVLFPKVVEQNVKGKNDNKLLKKALFLITLISLGCVIIYLLIPNFIVTLLFGRDYLGIVQYMVMFAIIMGLFSFVYVLSFYNLSINRTKFVYFLGLSILVEIILLFLYHDTIWHVLFVLLGLILATFIFMTIYTFFNGKTFYSNSSL